MNLKAKYDALCKEDEGIEKVSLKVALHFYKEIKNTCRDQAWPPCPEELNENYVEPPYFLKAF